MPTCQPPSKDSWRGARQGAGRSPAPACRPSLSICNNCIEEGEDRLMGMGGAASVARRVALTLFNSLITVPRESQKDGAEDAAFADQVKWP